MDHSSRSPERFRVIEKIIKGPAKTISFSIIRAFQNEKSGRQKLMKKHQDGVLVLHFTVLKIIDFHLKIHRC